MNSISNPGYFAASIGLSSSFMKKKELLLSLFILLIVCHSYLLTGQEIQTPLEKKEFSRPTTYQEICDFTGLLSQYSPSVKVDIAGKTVEGRNIYALQFSGSVFGSDAGKLRILIFAQQHGNEQSGKEAALLLARDLLKPANAYLLDRLDILIIPQVNPDGSEGNKRRNGNQADLNRNHLILTEPEVIAIHRLFDQYLFDVTLDVHEYYPFGESWKNFGYRNNSDVLLGVATNINVSSKLRDLSKNDYFPYMMDYLQKHEVSGFVYSPGGPPGEGYTRQSTFDINDGRQSFAIQNSFSFIQEGMNGKDVFADNLKRRALSQETGMRGLLEYAWIHAAEIKKTVAGERKQLISGSPDKVAIQCAHTPDGTVLHLPVNSYASGRDTTIEISDYRPVVKSILDVAKPSGYLIPKNMLLLMDWATRVGFVYGELPKHADIEQYKVVSIDSIDFEGDIVVNAQVQSTLLQEEIRTTDYLYLPTNQLKGNLLVIALEPRSMLGLVTYPLGSGLLRKGEDYPILRVVKK
ncbi:MAG: M14 family zinc carboxypeptidase [Bacteroidales bacterium]